MASRRRVPTGARGSILVAAALGLSLCVASCHQNDGSVGEQEAGAMTATVAALVPSADDEDLTSAGVIAAVESSIDAATTDLDDWKVRVQPVVAADGDDDTVAALEELLDDDLIAVVGGLDTSTVRIAQPVLDARDVIFVSPADVEPAHTRGADPTDPLRPYSSYFRTAVADRDPVVEAMQYASVAHGVDDVTVLDTDGGTEPVRGADAARAAGLEVVVPEPPEQGSTDDEPETSPVTGPVTGPDDLDTRVAAAVDTGADGIYLAAAPGRVPQILERLAAAGSEATVVGGSAFAGDVPPEAGGFTGPILRAREPELPPTINATPEGLDAVLDGAAPGQYGAAAYDAGAVVGAVLSVCLPSAASAPDARTGCLGEISHTRVTGMTGDVVFDEFGERVGAAATVEMADDGAWAAISEP